MEISEIVRKQKAYYDAGATRSIEFRTESLKKLQAAVRRNETRIAEALKEDLGKEYFESYMCETGLVLDEVRFHLRHLEKWARIRPVRTPVLHYHSRSYIVPEPYGTVLIMSPWNYPFNLCMIPFIGAIAAGNCAVVKPSIYAEATSHVIAAILSEIFPPEYVAVVEGGRQENTALLQEKFDYIFFTGSVAVGKTVMEAAAKTLTPVTLELGGKSPVIVDKTADIKLAARRIALGKVLNAGQTCVAPDYLLIEKSIRDAFIEEYRHALKRFFPSGDMSGMAVIISEKHYQRKKEMLKGQNAVVGGGFDDSRRFIEPTLLVDADPDSLVMQEEIFAPILPILTWDVLQEAIDFIRARPKPLALYLFTTDKSVEQRVFDTCAFGGGCVNDTLMQLASPYLSFGGVGNSGMGQYHGKASFDTFTHDRSILKKSNWLDLPVRYFPYSEKNYKLAKRILK
jgi:aldehyde dehydrogenase (NAD+)